ncbi:hypothetical protein NEHOM01_1144 [Nematocida homosporus]|uniref:uncharacterized protein n=1 Tax=Nematocida homosporus TaxID=1912981 RepID=UPI002220936A|nr:uncharacterized protein NEHOM01_1144 [Nematocida homosporus]KAI5185894.1 hypothetical protein NEHOM01_1144 [Nematocida homosporus]
MFRKDGRKYNQHRLVAISVQEAIYFNHGLSQVSTLLTHSPTQKQRLSIIVKMEEGSLPASASRIRTERKEEEIGEILEKIFTPLLMETDFCYEIEHRVIFADGSLLPLLINSTTFALEKFRIPIRHLIFALSCAVSKYEKDAYLIDTTDQEERDRLPAVVLAASYTEHQEYISFVEMSNGVPISSHSKLLHTAMDALKSNSTTLFQLCQQSSSS